jgi:beta-glucan synthesis-associated protein KRE6
MRSLSQRNTAGSLALVVLGTLVMLASGGFIDMDTPLDQRTTKSLIDGSTYDLVSHEISIQVILVFWPFFILIFIQTIPNQVMSDEFSVPNRSFTDGHDPIWTALDKSDDDSSSAGGGAQQFYNSSYVTTTEDGFLKISSIVGKTEWNRYDQVNREWKHEVSNFKSGMMQSWEKFCFTGGIAEVDIILPGDPYIGGLWPAVWILGNLGRATYEASTNNIWPWSYDTCNRSLQDAQTISACNRQNHYGMNPFQGRGATEIDLIEVMTGDNSEGPLPGTNPPVELPYADFTLQVRRH